jgi:hypothetical protein
VISSTLSSHSHPSTNMFPTYSSRDSVVVVISVHILPYTRVQCILRSNTFHDLNPSGDHVLIDICRDFLIESFSLFYCVLSSVSLCYEFSACCIGYIWCGRRCYCNDFYLLMTCNDES